MEEPTTGNIRSVNVDYLPEREEQQQSPRSPSLASSSSSGLPKFAPLDAAILETLQELSGQRAEVHVATLIEYFGRRYAHQIELPSVEYIDCALNGLERAGKLVTRPMGARQMEAALRVGGERGRQSVFVDRWLLLTAAAERQQHSKSTTLDSGIRSWDQRRDSSSPSNYQQQSAPTPSKKSSFSLRRSLSFRPQQAGVGRQQRGQSMGWRQTTKMVAPEEEEEQRPSGRQSTKLASLFRSRSLRAMSGGRWTTDKRQATIDYLASPVQQHQAGELGSNRLLHFLRRLFRSSQPQTPASSTFAPREPGSLAHEQLNSRNLQQQPSRPKDSPNQRFERRSTDGNKMRTTTTETTASQQLLAGSPSASSRSSGTDSLIEILDCSPALAGSRRKLREAQVGLGRPTRASRRHLERSNSSLSQSSCSTTKSTASQQLRRHLDEAYRRHRKCSSQREREFIDSINVLRQASRHALLEGQTRSPVKGRAKSGTQSDADSAELSASGRECLCSGQQQQHWGRQEQEAGTQQPTELDLIAQHTPDSLTSDCCLCLDGHLCPALACCPALTCCGHRQPPESGDDVCPLWRSLLYGPAACSCACQPNCAYNYNYNTYSNAISSNNNYALPLGHLMQPFEPQQAADGQQQLVASSQQLHQHQQSQHHQHNTTIDLKIEIGDFLAAAAAQSQVATRSRQAANEPDDDSLVSDLTTDESLAKLDTGYGQEEDSADSSLRNH